MTGRSFEIASSTSRTLLRRPTSIGMIEPGNSTELRSGRIESCSGTSTGPPVSAGPPFILVIRLLLVVVESPCARTRVSRTASRTYASVGGVSIAPAADWTDSPVGNRSTSRNRTLRASEDRASALGGVEGARWFTREASDGRRSVRVQRGRQVAGAADGLVVVVATALPARSSSSASLEHSTGGGGTVGSNSRGTVRRTLTFAEPSRSRTLRAVAGPCTAGYQRRMARSISLPAKAFRPNRRFVLEVRCAPSRSGHSRHGRHGPTGVERSTRRGR